jgi:DNA processing protein
LFARGAPDGFAEPPAPEPDYPPIDLARARSRVLELLGPSPTDIDDVIRRSQFPAGAVMAALSQLELALRIEIIPGNRALLIK